MVTLLVFSMLFCVLAWLSIASCRRESDNANGYWLIVWSTVAVCIFLLSAFRTGGSDWENYDYLYLYVSRASTLVDALTENFLFEPGYVALNYVASFLSADRRALVIFEAAVNALAIFLILTRVAAGPLFVCWLFPLQFANILSVRQTLATSLLIIAHVTYSNRGRLLAAIAAPSIHLSAVLFIAAAALAQRIRVKSILIGVCFIAGAAYLVSDLVVDKLANYSDNAADLTDLSGANVALGKALTLGVLALLHITSSYVAGRGQRLEFPLALYSAAALLALFSYYFPPAARVLVPFEFIAALYACQGIARIEPLKPRLALAGGLILITLLKMSKITSQLGEVYEVCFFC